MPLDLRTFLGAPPDPLKLIAERKILEWIESGGPERLTNRGAALDLTENPFTPEDLRMAHRIMHNAGIAPEWVQLGSDIERDLAHCREEVRRFHDAQRRDRLHARTASLDGLIALRARMRVRADEFRTAQTARYRHVNSQIARFNTLCPVASLHRVPANAEHEIEAALKADAPPVA